MVGDINDVKFTLNEAMSTDSEDESYEIITETTIGVESASESDEVELAEKSRCEESEPSVDAKIESENEEDVKEDAAELPKPCEESEQPQTLRERIQQFVADVGTEDLQNMFVVLHSLLVDGHDLPTGVRLAVETSDVAANHPLVQDMLPLLTVFAPKFQPWIPMLTSAFSSDQISALVPSLVES